MGKPLEKAGPVGLYPTSQFHIFLYCNDLLVLRGDTRRQSPACVGPSRFGGDATSNMEGGGGYNTGFVATPRAVVPTPVESLEEFRVATNNAGAEFTRSAGAEVQMVTKRGTNSWHGAGYWYHQNDELNANNWFRNNGFGDATAAPIQNPEWRDNRYGGKVGGPIWKNRTFFFVHEEERHFFTQAVFSRLVPTAAMRAGILEFKDPATGNIIPFNLNAVPTVDPGAFAG